MREPEMRSKLMQRPCLFFLFVDTTAPVSSVHQKENDVLNAALDQAIADANQNSNPLHVRKNGPDSEPGTCLALEVTGDLAANAPKGHCLRPTHAVFHRPEQRYPERTPYSNCRSSQHN